MVLFARPDVVLFGTPRRRDGFMTLLFERACSLIPWEEYLFSLVFLAVAACHMTLLQPCRKFIVRLLIIFAA